MSHSDFIFHFRKMLFARTPSAIHNIWYFRMQNNAILYSSLFFCCVWTFFFINTSVGWWSCCCHYEINMIRFNHWISSFWLGNHFCNLLESSRAQAYFVLKRKLARIELSLSVRFRCEWNCTILVVDEIKDKRTYSIIPTPHFLDSRAKASQRKWRNRKKSAKSKN